MTGTPAGKSKRKRGQGGTALVEFTLVLLPLLAFMFMTLDLAWLIFGWASIQEGVREGVRFAVTGRVLSGYACQDASIRAIIQETSLGFVNASNSSSVINIQYYLPTTLTPVSGVGSNAGGNVIVITAGSATSGPAQIIIHPLVAIWFKSTPFNLIVSSSDVMEGSPSSGPPCR